MVLEVAILNIIASQEHAFERAIEEARPLIAATAGFHSMEVRRCLETPSRYLLLVYWEILEDHTIGFRRSDRYQQWRTLLHHFYNPFPVVEHYSHPIWDETAI